MKYEVAILFVTVACLAPALRSQSQPPPAQPPAAPELPKGQVPTLGRPTDPSLDPVPLPQAVALQAFRIYYFLTHEDNLGDLFHDIPGTSVTTTAIGSILSGVYSDDVAPDTYILVGSNNQTYGPVNFTY